MNLFYKLSSTDYSGTIFSIVPISPIRFILNSYQPTTMITIYMCVLYYDFLL